MREKIRKIIRESLDFLLENDLKKTNIWDKYGDNLPSIFKQTIYRLPTRKELEEVNSFNLTSDDISQGFGYTIIGRGVLSDKNKLMIIKSIKMLCELYPNNKEYKDALNVAQDIKPKFRSLNEEFDEKKFMQDMVDEINSNQTCEELRKQIVQVCMGGFLPFNPPDPLRTIYRHKMEELRKTDPENFPAIECFYKQVLGEFKPTPSLPPGAMY